MHDYKDAWVLLIHITKKTNKNLKQSWLPAFWKKIQNTQEIKRALFNNNKNLLYVLEHVLPCSILLKSVLLISCVFWIHTTFDVLNRIQGHSCVRNINSNLKKNVFTCMILRIIWWSCTMHHAFCDWLVLKEDYWHIFQVLQLSVSWH